MLLCLSKAFSYSVLSFLFAFLLSPSFSLKTYLSKLVVFPRQGRKAKKGFGGMPDDTLLQDVQDKIAKGVSIKHLMPLPKQTPKVEFLTRAEAEKIPSVRLREKKAKKPKEEEK